MIENIVLSCVCLFLAILYLMERSQNKKERKELLNRLMAKDYKEYAGFEHQKAALKQKSDKLIVDNTEEGFDTLPLS